MNYLIIVLNIITFLFNILPLFYWTFCYQKLNKNNKLTKKFIDLGEYVAIENVILMILLISKVNFLNSLDKKVLAESFVTISQSIAFMFYVVACIFTIRIIYKKFKFIDKEDK